MAWLIILAVFLAWFALDALIVLALCRAARIRDELERRERMRNAARRWS